MFTVVEMPDRIAHALAAVAPSLAADTRAEWAAALAPPMASSGLITPRRVAMFLGQVSEETGGLKVLAEDMDYTLPARLHEVWPERFPTIMAAAAFVRQPERLANYVYANRLGNGSPESGDGWRFRGAGLIQLTGRALYAECGAALGGRTAEQMADWMLTPEGASASACWYWSLRRLNPYADAWNISEVTRLINGGEVNLARRTLLCGQALRTLAV